MCISYGLYYNGIFLHVTTSLYFRSIITKYYSVVKNTLVMCSCSTKNPNELSNREIVTEGDAVDSDVKKVALNVVQ